MSPDAHDPALAAASREVLRRHARSFRVAARLLSEEQAADAAICYAFCREVDDLIDEAPDLEQARVALARWREETRGSRPARPLIEAWRALAARRGFPIEAGLQLIDAVGTDAGAVRIADDRALLDYAMGVAGTVGLMMCGILGAPASARPQAVDLGIAMQLTNIARDVAEDARRDRVYLPATRLALAGLSPADVLAGRADDAALAAIVRGLVLLAERYYRSAIAGMARIPWRGRLAVAVAAGLYRAIGRKVVRRGAEALRGRAVLGALELSIGFLQGLGLFLRASLGRRLALPAPGLYQGCTAQGRP